MAGEVVGARGPRWAGRIVALSASCRCKLLGRPSPQRRARRVGSFALGARNKPITSRSSRLGPRLGRGVPIRPGHLLPSAAHGHPRGAKMVKPRTSDRYTTG
eukprot:scaffold103335_cov60-Phaeocystis_antarctica.AAC.2